MWMDGLTDIFHDGWMDGLTPCDGWMDGWWMPDERAGCMKKLEGWMDV